MTTTLAVDKAGRVVLPKRVRDGLQVGPGDSLELEVSEDQIILRPARGRGRIYKKNGALVFDSGKSLSAKVVEDTIRKVRLERERAILGKRPWRHL